MVIKNGSAVTLDYRAYVDDHIADQTNPDEPFVYIQGTGQIIPGLEKNLEGLDRGDKKEIIVPPKDAYGEYSEERIIKVPKDDMQEETEPHVGMQVQATGLNGDVYVGIITDVEPDHINVDFNHPLAGRTLRFEVEVLDVQD